MKDVKLMLGREPHCYYKATWMVISPLTIIVSRNFFEEATGLLILIDI